MNNSGLGKHDKFTAELRGKLLKDLAANYLAVERCNCGHRDRIQSFQENLQYYKRMTLLHTVWIIFSLLVLLLLMFFMGLEVGVALSNSPYGRSPCISTVPFWRDSECDVAY